MHKQNAVPEPPRQEKDYADVFVCSSEESLHSYYYIAPEPYQADVPYYRVSRTGIELQLPRIFLVERKATTPFCQIFCILSGHGTLTVRGRVWPLHENQLVLLAAGEAHSYRSSPDDPLQLSWLEFYGGDSVAIMRRLIERYSPVVEGDVFHQVTAELNELQQRLMAQEDYCPSREIYGLLYALMRAAEHPDTPQVRDDVRKSLRLAQRYLDAHPAGQISNGHLAALCGVSVQYFSRRFKEQFHMTPQEYHLHRRIVKAKYLLTRTTTSVEEIAVQLGFCNASHFIRRFRRQEGMTPSAYRRQFSGFMPAP